MKVIFNKILPPKNFMAITIIKGIFIREEYKTKQNKPYFQTMLRHEHIHEQQILDFTSAKLPLGIRYTIGSFCFYILYLLEGLCKLLPALIKRKNAYESLSFEQEAYNNQNILNYLTIRKRFTGIKYIFKLN